jgi:ribose 1,5-bisphosphate isomerase
MRPSLQRFVHRLKALEIQGAKQIAIRSLLFLKAYDPTFGRTFERAAKQLEAARPTAVVLHNCLEILRRERSTESVDVLVNRLRNASEEIGRYGAKLIRSGCVVMTHCHSGEALAVVKAAKRAGRRVGVIATLTEPAHQGIRTARELRNAGIPVTLIADPAIGFFMPHVDVIITGSDAMRREGNVNKIGTYPLALVAAKHRKPYYVVGNTFKLDRRKTLAIEERPPGEVWRAMKGVKMRNPAFDITPWQYVTRVITERGVKTPKQIVKMIEQSKW